MNYVRHLNAFFALVRSDQRLTSSHVSLYLALFYYWNHFRFQNPFSVYREDLMQISKIGSKNTYHKCLRQLHQYEYISCHTTVSKFAPVQITIVPLSIPDSTKIDTATVPNQRHLNKLNIKQKRETPTPTFEEIEFFFKQNKYPPDEAKKFYNHYKAIGWKIQGITPIEDWQALAEKWMQNASKYCHLDQAKRSERPPQGAEALPLDQLYKQYQAGWNIYQKLTPEHFTDLKLTITPEVIQRANKIRIDQVAGTNQHSLNQLWDAYLTGDEKNQLIQKDKPVVELIAKRLAILDHFKKQNQLKQ